jgi:hypothetical protein
MKKSLAPLLVSVFLVSMLAGCGGGGDVVSDDSTYGNIGDNGAVNAGNSAVGEAIADGGVGKVSAVESKSNLDLPDDAIIFTQLSNVDGTFGFSFFSYMETFALQAYFENEFEEDGYSQKRPWADHGVGSAPTQSSLYGGPGTINVSISDEGNVRKVNITLSS